jgi:hypothetical protein
MLISFFDVAAIVQREFVPPGQIENHSFLCVETITRWSPVRTSREVAEWGLVLAP